MDNMHGMALYHNLLNGRAPIVSLNAAIVTLKNPSVFLHIRLLQIPRREKFYFGKLHYILSARRKMCCKVILFLS